MRAARAQVSAQLAARLKSDPAFLAVNNGDAAQLERDREFLFRHRYLLSPDVTPQRFTAAGLRAAISDSLDVLASPEGPLVKPLFTHDPTGELLAIIDSMGEARVAAHRLRSVDLARWRARAAARADARFRIRHRRAAGSLRSPAARLRRGAAHPAGRRARAAYAADERAAGVRGHLARHDQGPGAAVVRDQRRAHRSAAACRVSLAAGARADPGAGGLRGAGRGCGRRAGLSRGARHHPRLRHHADRRGGRLFHLSAHPESRRTSAARCGRRCASGFSPRSAVSRRSCRRPSPGSCSSGCTPSPV